MRVVLLCWLLFLPSVVVAQDPEPLGRGELFGAVGGAKFEGLDRWTIGGAAGFAVDAFRKPSVPLLFEYVGVVQTEETIDSFSSLSVDFFGGGLRFGGDVKWFGSFTAGFAKLGSSFTQTIGGTLIPETSILVGGETQSVSTSFTRPGLSFAGGLNLPARPHWGIRFEVRGTTIKDVGAWMYGVNIGAYYRLGKKP